MRNNSALDSGFVHILILAIIVLTVTGAVAANVKVTSNVDSNVKGVYIAKSGEEENKTDENKQEEDKKEEEVKKAEEVKKEDFKKQLESQKEEAKKQLETKSVAKPVTTKSSTSNKNFNTQDLEDKNESEKEHAAEVEDEIDNETEDGLENELSQTEIESEFEDHTTKEKFKFKLNNGKIEIEMTDKDGQVLKVSQKDNQQFRIKTATDSAETDLDLETDGEKFKLKTNGIEALTSLPVSFDEATSSLIVTTPNGDKIVRVLPDEVIKIVQNSALVTSVDNIELIQKTNEDLVFKLKGSKQGKLFGFIPVSTNIESEVDAETGEALTVSQPLWFRIFSGVIR